MYLLKKWLIESEKKADYSRFRALSTRLKKREQSADL
jgi:hypothetical protein